MRPSTVLRLALAGTRTDTLRVVLTAVTAALAAVALLAAATVIAIPELGAYVNNTQYRANVLAEPGLRGGVVFGLVMLTLPVLALAAQCGRLGAPARDRRLAAIRLAGATPRQTVVIVVAETAVASLLGSALGLAAYLVGRQLAHRPDAAGKLALPTDVLPGPWVLATICLGMPLLATLVAVVQLRRVAVTPFGAVRRVRTRPPRSWPGLLIMPGVGVVALLQPLATYLGNRGTALPSWVVLLVVTLGAVLAMLGVVLGTGWISYAAGRVLHRFARRPAALLAARRLVADPWSGSRTFAALLVGVIFGAGAAGLRAQFAADFAIDEEGSRLVATQQGEPFFEPRDTAFYFQTLDMVDLAVMVAVSIAAVGLLVALAEGIVSRRRAYTALVATGVPRSTLARSVLWQVSAPVVSAVLVALAVGVSFIRGLFGDEVVYHTEYAECLDAQCSTQGPLQTVDLARSIPVPLGELAILGAGTLAVVMVVVGLSLLLLRSSTTVEELRTT